MAANPVHISGDYFIPPDDLRCSQINSGDGEYRCRNWRLQDMDFCQTHFLQRRRGVCAAMDAVAEKARVWVSEGGEGSGEKLQRRSRGGKKRKKKKRGRGRGRGRDIDGDEEEEASPEGDIPARKRFRGRNILVIEGGVGGDGDGDVDVDSNKAKAKRGRKKRAEGDVMEEKGVDGIKREVSVENEVSAATKDEYLGEERVSANGYVDDKPRKKRRGRKKRVETSGITEENGDEEIEMKESIMEDEVSGMKIGAGLAGERVMNGDHDDREEEVQKKKKRGRKKKVVSENAEENGGDGVDGEDGIDQNEDPMIDDRGSGDESKKLAKRRGRKKRSENANAESGGGKCSGKDESFMEKGVPASKGDGFDGDEEIDLNEDPMVDDQGFDDESKKLAKRRGRKKRSENANARAESGAGECGREDESFMEKEVPASKEGVFEDSLSGGDMVSEDEDSDEKPKRRRRRRRRRTKKEALVKNEKNKVWDHDGKDSEAAMEKDAPRRRVRRATNGGLGLENTNNDIEGVSRHRTSERASKTKARAVIMSGAGEEVFIF